MIQHGNPPYLECSSRGDLRFSALYARLRSYDFQTIESLYQSAKLFTPNTIGVSPDGRMINWRDAKGKQAINQSELVTFYDGLWVEYITENPHLFDVLITASGLSDMFGQPGHVCQATSLWTIRNRALQGRI